MPFMIYKIRFRDGAEYVGITMQDIKQRLIKHKSHPSNREVATRLRKGVEHDITVLHKGMPLERAVRLEREEIAKLAKPLNVVGASVDPAWTFHPPMPKRNYRKWNPEPPPRPPNGKIVRCSLCHAEKPASEFNSDRSRSSGLASKCKACVNRYQSATRKASKEGRSISAAYQKVRKEIIAERGSGNGKALPSAGL